MKNILPIINLMLLLLIATACGSDPATTLADETLTEVAKAKADSIMKQATDKSIAEVSEKRDTVEPSQVAIDTPPPKSEGKRKQWMLDSPFGELENCMDWQGNESKITAACCKSLIIAYGQLIAKGENLAGVKTKDPYLASCKRFNSEIREVLENMENPPRESDDIPF